MNSFGALFAQDNVSDARGIPKIPTIIVFQPEGFY